MILREFKKKKKNMEKGLFYLTAVVLYNSQSTIMYFSLVAHFLNPA